MRKKFNLKSLILKLSIIFAVIAIDLVSKELFYNYLSDGKKVDIITNVFSLQYTQNTGAAYGIFSNSTTMLIVVSALFIVILSIYDFLNSSDEILYNISFAFILGGAVGNLIDRIFLGYVRDFANFEIFKFIFNLADAFITIGAVLYVIYILISIKKEKDSKKLLTQSTTNNQSSQTKEIENNENKDIKITKQKSKNDIQTQKDKNDNK